MSRPRKVDAATIAITVAELREIVRAEIEAALARVGTRPVKRSKPTEDWTPEAALAAVGARVRK